MATDYRCISLKLSPPRVKAGEPFTVTAAICDTFLDGSRVTLYLDDRPVDARWAWARGSRVAEAVFPLTLPKPGEHRVDVANQRLTILAQ